MRTGKELVSLPTNGAFLTAPVVFSPDGRTVAGGCTSQVSRESKVLLWEAASGSLRCEFAGHLGTVSSLTFSPDGRTLASGSWDTSVILWDLAGRLDEKRAPVPLTKKDQAELWQALTDPEARNAYPAMFRLIAEPREAVPLFRQNLRPAEGKSVDAATLRQLIADLDHEQFVERERATRELEQLGPAAGEALRLTKLLDKLEAPGLPPEMLRPIRALEVLERIGTPEARQVVETLARGESKAILTQEAQATLRRLGPPSR
jgi:hypothetical protein